MSGRGRILVIEDNATSRKMFRLTLESEGYSVVEAADAQHGIEALSREAFDVVMQDLVLPDMHGFDLVRKLRELPHGVDVPIIAVSGFLSRLEEAQAVGMGFTTLLVKPVEPSRLVDATAMLLPSRSADVRLRGAGRVVLVVNDDPVQLKLARLRLAMMGFEILSAESGAEALGIAHERVPDAILSDVLMPLMDGFELCLKVRSDPLLHKVPLLLVSAHYGSTADHELARRVGANALVQATAEFAEVPPALAHAIEQGAPDTVVDPAVEIRLDHAGAVGRQLEKQLASVSGMAQRCTLLSAEVALLSSVSAALANNRDPASALKGVLSATLDAAGISKGALYLREPDRRLALSHSIGFDGRERKRLNEWLAEAPIDERILRGQEPLTLDSPQLSEPARALLEGIGVDSAQIVPLKSRNEDFGLLVLGACSTDVVSHDAIDFAHTFAGQIVQALELERAFAQTAESEQRFRQIAENIRMVFFLTNGDNSRVLYVSPAYEQIWGRSCASLYADHASWAEAIHPDDRVRVLETDSSASRESTFNAEYRIVRADGTMRWIGARGFPVRDAAGNVYRIAAIAEDITERKEIEHKLGRLTRLRALIGSITSGILRLRERGDLLREMCRICVVEGVFPLAWVASIGRAAQAPEILAFDSDDPESRNLLQKAFESVPEGNLPSYRAARSAQRVIVNDVCADPLLESIHGELIRRNLRSCAAFPLLVNARVVAVLVLLAREAHFFDEQELELLNILTGDICYALADIEKSQRLDHLAYYDALTELANARLFHDRLEQFIAAARREVGKVCLVVLDIEDFTRVNETLGRPVGDRLLFEMGERLQRHLVEPFALGRIGADTFAAASPRDNGMIATKLRDRMFKATSEPFVIDGHEIRLSAQAGIAFFPSDGEDAVSVFKNAEVALKLAKSSGDRHVYYSSEIHTRIAQRLALEEQLNKAIDAQQFVVHYQARVDMISGELVGAEALIRWQHPDRGLVAPGEFIALAEETGLIVPIGAWVIRQVCAQQTAWVAMGIAAVPIAVNVSSVQFEKGDLVQTVIDALAAHALDAKYLELELTESAVMADPAVATRILQTLHKFGVNLALDDFGTGYSSLAHLKRFPFDSVKIDQSFISHITSNPEDAAIASAIIAMAHSLNLKVVAEGIETQGQFNFLRGQGCDGMQGFYFSAAVPKEEFEAQLRAGKRITLPAPASGDEQTLLVVDDEAGIRSALTRTLRRDGYRILSAPDGAAALEVLAVNHVQVIISDQRMPGMSGTEFLNVVKQLYPDTMRIILSGYTDLEVVTDSVNRGAVFKFLTKPWEEELLREQVRDAFRRYQPDRRALKH